MTLRDEFDVARDKTRALGIQLSLQGGPVLDELADRVARQKEAYDGGTVHTESSKLQALFHHVFECSNSRKTEEFLDRVVGEYAAHKDILDYGC